MSPRARALRSASQALTPPSALDSLDSHARLTKAFAVLSGAFAVVGVVAVFEGHPILGVFDFVLAVVGLAL